MLLWIAIATYLLSGFFSIKTLLGNHKVIRWQLYGPAVVGLVAHSIHLVSTVSINGMLQFSLLNTISICVWLTIGVVLISAVTKPIHNLFTFFMPLGGILLFIGVITPQMASPKAYSNGMVFHIFVALLAYSIMIITTLQAILVNIQSNHLQKHHLNNRILKLLPPLQSMERMMFEWLMVGFMLLTVAIITGGMYVSDIFAQHLIHKTVLTIIAWFFFAVLIFGHFYLGWRGQQASRMVYLGMIFLLVAFVGSKFILEYLIKIG